MRTQYSLGELQKKVVLVCPASQIISGSGVKSIINGQIQNYIYDFQKHLKNGATALIRKMISMNNKIDKIWQVKILKVQNQQSSYINSNIILILIQISRYTFINFKIGRMKAIIFALFALLLISSNAVRLENHLVLTQQEAQQKLVQFMVSEQDLFDTIMAEEQFSEEQNHKIYKWMIDDDQYREYMISTMEPPEDEFLKDLFHNNPKDYLDMIFAFARMEDAQETQGGPEAEAEEAQAEGQQ